MNKSGIYKIINKIDGKFYIGSAYNLQRRWNNHCRKSSNIYLRRAIKKFGIENFIFEILEYVDICKLLEREQYYLNLFEPTKYGYNISPTAVSTFGVRGDKCYWFKRIKPKDLCDKISKTLKGRYVGELNPSCKLNIKQVKEIRKLREEGLTLKQIADKFRVGISTIHRIVKFQNWKNV